MEIKKLHLKEISSLRVGGVGDVAEVFTVGELQEALVHAKAEGLRVHVLGAGTNSYFGERLEGVLFIRPHFFGIEIDGDHVTAHASVVWDDLVKHCVDEGLWGIENLSYIPGTVGAAPVQNIGAYGVELSHTCSHVTVLDVETGEVVQISKEACAFGYRTSIFKYMPGRYIILSITLHLSLDPRPVLFYKPLDKLAGKEHVTLDEIRSCVIETRMAKLPDYREHPNAGSFFKNPYIDQGAASLITQTYPDMPLIEVPEGYKVPAAWLIEHVADMKGTQRGSVGTWPKQPLVIVNYGEATADDIDTFAKEIKDKVYLKTGITLEQEVNRIA